MHRLTAAQLKRCSVPPFPYSCAECSSVCSAAITLPPPPLLLSRRSIECILHYTSASASESMLLPAIHYIDSSQYTQYMAWRRRQIGGALVSAESAAAPKPRHTATNYLDVIRDAVGPGQDFRTPAEREECQPQLSTTEKQRNGLSANRNPYDDSQ